MRLNPRFAVDDPLTSLSSVASPDDLFTMQEEAKKVHVDDKIYDYAVSIIEATRKDPDIRVGASPRALLSYVAAAKALALLRGRDFVTPDDLKELAVPVLAHRISIHSSGSFSRDGEYASVRDRAASVITKVVDSVTCPTEKF